MKRFRWLAITLVGITFLVGLCQIFIPAVTDHFALIAARAWSEPWMFVTSMFLHGNVGHFLLNMFGLALFGSILEKIIGSNRFLLVFFGTGIFANLIGVFFYSASLGASGAVMGILGTLAVLRPNMIVWISYIPMPMWLAAIVWAAIDVLGIFAPNGIANITHLAGMGCGLLLGRAWRRKYYRKKIIG